MPISVIVTVLVAEELGLVREGIAALCESRCGLSVVAQCADGAQALDALRRLKPGIAILSDDLGDMPAVDVIRAARREGSSVRMIVVAAQCDRRAIAAVLGAGAHAVVLRSAPASDLIEALDAALDGRVYLSPALELDTLAGGDSASGPDPMGLLSQRERQVFSLLVQGVRAKQIAGRMELSPKTVDTYRSSVMRKLDIHDVAGLVKFAIQRKLIGV